MATKKQIEEAAKDSRNWLKKKQKKHLKMVEEATKNLQQNILDQLSVLSTKSGNLEGLAVNITNLQTIQNKIEVLYGSQFDTKMQELVSDFRSAQDQIISNFGIVDEAVRFTKVDLDMMSTLMNGSYRDYLALSGTSKNKVIQEMYNHVIGGNSFGQLVNQINASLVGSKAVSVTGRSLAQYSRLYARDMIMNFHNDVMLKKAQDIGMEYFLYYGTIMSGTRDFCKRRVGNTYSKKEINSWNYKWRGKAGPAFTFRGGYNCRHHWQPVRKEWLSEEEQQNINSIFKLDKEGNPVQNKRKLIQKQVSKHKIKTKETIKYNPVMSQIEADKWSIDSVIKENLYHGTNSRAVNKIKQEGFKLSTSDIGGKAYGEAIYLTDEKRVAARFAGPQEGGVVVKTKINVDKVFVVKNDEHWFRLMDEAEKVNLPFLGKDGPNNIKKFFTDKGYQVLDVRKYERLGGIVVYDTKKITIVKE